MKKIGLITAALLAQTLGAVLGTSCAVALDLSQTFRDPETGKLVPDSLSPDKTKPCDGAEGPCLTLGAAIFHSLLRSYADEQSMDPAKLTELKFRRGSLANKLLDKKTATLTKEQVDETKSVVGRLYSPPIVFQAFRMLDPSLKDDDK